MKPMIDKQNTRILKNYDNIHHKNMHPKVQSTIQHQRIFEHEEPIKYPPKHSSNNGHKVQMRNVLNSQYLGKIYFGSPKSQDATVVFDTGSNWLTLSGLSRPPSSSCVASGSCASAKASSCGWRLLEVMKSSSAVSRCC